MTASLPKSDLWSDSSSPIYVTLLEKLSTRLVTAACDCNGRLLVL